MEGLNIIYLKNTRTRKI